jgi:hypothetical protein
MIVAEMEAPRGTHPREHAFVLSRKIHTLFLMKRNIIRCNFI